MHERAGPAWAVRVCHGVCVFVSSSSDLSGCVLSGLNSLHAHCGIHSCVQTPGFVLSHTLCGLTREGLIECIDGSTDYPFQHDDLALCACMLSLAVAASS